MGPLLGLWQFLKIKTLENPSSVLNYKLTLGSPLLKLFQVFYNLLPNFHQQSLYLPTQEAFEYCCWLKHQLIPHWHNIYPLKMHYLLHKYIHLQPCITLSIHLHPINFHHHNNPDFLWVSYHLHKFKYIENFIDYIPLYMRHMSSMKHKIHILVNMGSIRFLWRFCMFLGGIKYTFQ